MTGKPRGRYYDITGVRYGRLVVLRKGPSRSGQTSWDCLCDCGTEVNILKHSLVCGATTSCGCYMRERSAEEIVKRVSTHGLSKTPEYSVWCGMKRRCENPNEQTYPRYGGAGIKVRFSCFEDFLAEVGQRPSSDHSIDRIDPYGHYEKGNVRWAVKSVQARNTRKALLIVVNGDRRPLAAFCEDHGVSYKLAWERLKRGWTTERALGVRQ